MPLDVSKYFLLTPQPTGQPIQVGRGSDAPVITGGGARWTTVERPRRVSIVQWDGDDPYTMDVSIMIDGWTSGTNVEDTIAQVNQLHQSSGDLSPPPYVTITGAVPVKGATWVITGIDWGTSTIWGADSKNGKGYRLRQDAVIHFLQWVPETVLQRNPVGATRPYRVPAGATLASIATKFGVTVASILQASGIRDPKSVKPGDTIKIPPKVSSQQYTGQ